MQKFFLIQVNPRCSRSISGEQWRPQFLSPAPCHCLSEEMRLGSMKFSGVVKNSVAGADFYTLLMPSRPGVNNFRFLSPRWLLNRPGASLVNNGPGVLHSLFFEHCRAVHLRSRRCTRRPRACPLSCAHLSLLVNFVRRWQLYYEENKYTGLGEIRVGPISWFIFGRNDAASIISDTSGALHQSVAQLVHHSGTGNTNTISI
jgi:hypothetical protein